LTEERKGFKRANAHMIFLPAEFVMAITHVMSKMEIGNYNAILLVICEGLKNLDLIDDPTYGLFKARYSRKLLDLVNRKRVDRANAGKEKPRCSKAAGSAMKCRRLATVTMKKGDRMVSSCPEHIEEFKKHGYEVLEET